jgi:hypothetical protein
MVEKPVVEHVGAGEERGHQAAVLGLQVKRSAVEHASQPAKETLPNSTQLHNFSG